MPRFVLSLCLSLLGSTAAAAEIRAGASAVDITPEPGTPMAGYYHERAAEGVHDPLFAKALVLDVGGSKAALVALDLITTTRDLVADARREIETACGIPGDRVMISATHAHTGPVISGRGPRDDVFGGGSPKAKAYRAALPGKIALAVKQAADKAVPANLLVGHGQESSIAFNRRFHMKDGSVGWNPGKLNPAIVKAAGNIDPDVPIVYAESKDHKPIGVNVNYAVHLDNVGGSKVSADLPYTLSRLMADVKGPETVTLFTAGCCGDVNHIDVGWAERQSGHENAARMGIILAAEVLRTWPKLRAIEPDTIRARSVTVPLPLPAFTAEELKTAQDVAKRTAEAKTATPSFMDAVKAFKILDVAAREEKPIDVEVQTITLGDQLAFVSLPGEIFVELGMAIKLDSPFPTTVVAELANGAIGYIPSKRAYPQGNYEVVSARCAEGSGEMLVEAAVRSLSALHGEALKAATPAPGAPAR